MSTHPEDDLTDLRLLLVVHEEKLMERKVRAYEDADTVREAHLDGQITGVRQARTFLDEIVRTARA